MTRQMVEPTGKRKRGIPMSKNSGSDATSRILGGLAVTGSLATAVTDLLGVALSDRIGLAADTISDMAAGEYDLLADLGLYAFVLGVLAATAGLLRWRIDRKDWKIGAALLVVYAAAVTLIAAYEAYSTGDGPVIHIYLVYTLGVAFPLAALLTAGQIYEIDKRIGIACYLLGGTFALLGPGLFMMPTGWDGLYERFLAFLMLAWFVIMGVMICRDPDIAHQVSAEQQGKD